MSSTVRLGALGRLMASPILSVSLCGVAGAAPIFVTPADSIQVALDSSADGDVLYLAPGNYTECVLVQQGVRADIRSVEGSASTTITCDGSNDVTFDVLGSLKLAGVTLENVDGGALSATGPSLDLTDVVATASTGTAVVIRGGAANPIDVTMHSVTIEGGVQQGGNAGNLYLGNALAILNDLTLLNGSASQAGGGAYVTSSLVEAYRLTATGNSAAAGAGLYVASGSLDLVDSTLQSGIATTSGGGVYVAAGGELRVLDSTITGNQAPTGGGIYVVNDTQVIRSTIRSNTASNRGGGVFVEGTTGDYGSVVFSGTTFDGNTATGSAGVYSLAVAGGAIYANGRDVSSRGNTYSNNTAVGQAAGGAVAAETDFYSVGDRFVGNAAGSGGALYGSESGNRLLLRQTEIEGNTASALGGGVYLPRTANLNSEWSSLISNTGSLQGGGMHMDDTSSADWLGGYIVDNTATVTRGGGVYVSKDASLFVWQAEIAGNSAAAEGGGISSGSQTPATGSIALANVYVHDNTARVGGGVHAAGLALSVMESRIIANTASDGGGGISAYRTAAFDVTTSVFCQNSADAGAALQLEETSGSRSLSHSGIWSNTAAGDGGAVLVRGAYTADSVDLLFRYNTVVGNTSTSSNASGLAVDVSTTVVGTVSVTDSVFASNSAAALAQVNGSVSGALGYQGTMVFDHPLTNGVFNTPDLTDLDGNVNADPGLAAYLPQDCVNTDLTAFASSHLGGSQRGWIGLGVGVGAGLGAPTPFGDFDGDGYSIAQGDCDDSLRTANPGTAEVPADYVDQDCDFLDDWDGDGDGFLTSDFDGTDCDDSDASINLDAAETYYDGIRQSCQTITSDSDADRDGDSATTDCDDTNSSANSFAVDLPYDGVDADCDGAADDDLDGDGDASSDYASGTDCDDFDATVNGLPTTTEIWYDGIDQNCDGANDFDRDGDGQESADFGGDDCDDTDRGTYLGAPEVWYDGVDQDCDGGDDFDQDQDGYVSDQFQATYTGPLPFGDCDDADGDRYPGNEEIPDGKDNDCDGNSDPDSDDDGIIDYFEELYGSNPNNPDSDADGIPDGTEWGETLDTPVDSDGDSEPDVLDADSDNDGVQDVTEGETDTDEDGLPDYIDDDDDNDGLPTIEEDALSDADLDGLADYKDPDSDGDGVWDGIDTDPNTPFEKAESPAKPEGPDYGCGCASTGSVTGWWGLVGLAALLVRRRRRV